MRGNLATFPMNNPEPLVSILVPAYNHQDFVIDCLDSIKNLAYARLELIVSDDCSTDSTQALAREWVQRNAGRFERAIVIGQRKNLGVVRNIQFLFDNAQGEYLTCIASDDLLVESSISGRVKALQKDAGIDAVFGNAQGISASGDILQDEFLSKRVVRELSTRRLLLASLLLNWWVPGPVLMLRRKSVLEDGSLGRLPTDLEGEDRYIYVRLASLGKLRFINEIVAKYRKSPSSMSAPTGFSDRYFIASDQKNKHLLTGFNRFVIDNRIARMKTELESGLASKIKKMLLQAVGMQLMVILVIGSYTIRKS
jgi:glycosyltransferase involved in cell wall biosynthesis